MSHPIHLVLYNFSVFLSASKRSYTSSHLILYLSNSQHSPQEPHLRWPLFFFYLGLLTHVSQPYISTGLGSTQRILNCMSGLIHVGECLQYRYYLLYSGDIAVGTGTGYGLDGRGVGVRLLVGARFFPLHFFRTGSGPHSASDSMETRDHPFPRVKRLGLEVDRSPLTSSEA
jgi:hypothetical protein